MRESLDRRAKRGFALVLLLAALLVRGAIPQGYMAESSSMSAKPRLARRSSDSLIAVGG